MFGPAKGRWLDDDEAPDKLGEDWKTWPIVLCLGACSGSSPLGGSGAAGRPPGGAEVVLWLAVFAVGLVSSSPVSLWARLWGYGPARLVGFLLLSLLGEAPLLARYPFLYQVHPQ